MPAETGAPGPAGVTRSLSVDVVVADELRQPVVNAIRRYRAACRQLYAVLLLSQQAGAEIVETDEVLRVLPKNEAAKAVLASALGKGGKALGYELRDWFRQELYPQSLSFVWDSARRDVAAVWTAADPEHPRATRGYLALQGARGIAQFARRGLGFPLATARPKLAGHT